MLNFVIDVSKQDLDLFNLLLLNWMNKFSVLLKIALLLIVHIKTMCVFLLFS